jgi:AbrB family looped-hinge helix DNA binding protein
MKAILSEKGQITIPKSLRAKLGLKPGQILDFEARRGLLIGRKTGGKLNPVDAVAGVLSHLDFDVDEEINLMRGRPWNAEDDAPREKRR